jgi:hypothetical protein
MAAKISKPADPYDISEAKLQELEGSISFKKDELDEAYIEQPQLYWRVAQETAMMISWVDAAKMEYDNTRAGVDLAIRQQCADAGVKTTETQIAAQVGLNDDVQTASRNLSRWKTLAALWDGMEKTYRQRLTALDGMTRLANAEWFTRSSSIIDAQHREMRRQASAVSTTRVPHRARD